MIYGYQKHNNRAPTHLNNTNLTHTPLLRILATSPLDHSETPRMPTQSKAPKTTPTGKVRFNTLLPIKLLKGVTALAHRRGTSNSEIIREALRQYVIQELKKEKDIKGA